MASMTNVDRIEFAPFFSVAPVNGLMVAAHRKENYEKDDIIAEVINTNFGRTPELKLFGGFANGIDISVSEPKELNANQLKQVAENAKSSNQFEMIVERSDILVCTTSFPAEGHQYQCYVFITPKGILKSLVPLDIMSKAEADSYRKMFASALPMGASTDKQQTGKTSHQTQQEAAASALKAEGEQLISAYNRTRADLLSRFQRDLNQMSIDYNHQDITAYTSIRQRFRMRVNSTGYELCNYLRNLSEDGEKLVQRGADTAFIRQMTQTFRIAQEDLDLQVNVDTGISGISGVSGEWHINFNIPYDVKALPDKWEQILNNHPDIAAERLKETREAETKRVNNLIRDVKKKLAELKNDDPNRREQAEKAVEKYEHSADTLEMRIADTQDSFDLEIERDETQRETLKQKCMDFEQKIQQARTDHSNAFFLAFSKKKALLALIDDLTKQRAQCSQQISDLDRKIEEAGRNKAKEVEKIQQAHDDLRMEMEQAKVRVEQLPAEISEAEKDLADAQERLKKIPEMSLKELNARPRKPAPAPASKPKNDAQPTVKTEEQKLEDKILNVLSGAYKMTVSEIMSSDPELSPMKISAQRVSALLRQMTMKGLIVREEEMRKAYFRLP